MPDRRLREERGVAIGERLHQFLVKVRLAIGNRRTHALLVETAGTIDFLVKARAQIAALASYAYRSFVVQLNL
jgi:hypothetical protein